MSRTNRKWMPSNIHQMILEAPRPESPSRCKIRGSADKSTPAYAPPTVVRRRCSIGVVNQVVGGSQQLFRISSPFCVWLLLISTIILLLLLRCAVSKIRRVAVKYARSSWACKPSTIRTTSSSIGAHLFNRTFSTFAQSN